MLNNYRYFITLAEEQNISRAARRLYISHQCLSKYLKDLEAHYHIALFDRNPRLSLTPAGQMLYESYLQIALIEENISNNILNYKDTTTGVFRFGTTEGRYRILIPELLTEFQKKYPNVQLITECASPEALIEMVLNNQLDMVLTGTSAGNPRLASDLVINETLNLVISDTMLQKYFPNRYPECCEAFADGADLRQFEHVPFILNKKGFASRNIIDLYLRTNDIHLFCYNELPQSDVHYLLSARDYAASFCFSMYIPTVLSLSENSGSKLHIFPISGLDVYNPIRLFYLKNRIFPSYGRHLKKLIGNLCSPYTPSAPH